MAAGNGIVGENHGRATMPVHPFNSAFIDELRASCGSFPRTAVPEPETMRRAAVGIVVLPMANGEGEAGFILTLRTAKLRAHSGQFALPGGRLDEGETAVDAVLREIGEELGLYLEEKDVVGVLDDYPTRSGYVITPVVLVVHGNPPILPNPEEVAQVHHIRLSEITGEGAAQFVAIRESDRPVIRFPLLGVFIHAPAAAIFYQFAELLGGRITRVSHLEQPVFAWR